MSRGLEGTVALVTGGSSGIGLATARRLAAAGARVWLVARDAGRLEKAAAEVGGQVRSLTADVTAAGDPERVVREIEAGDGRLDILVNSAGQLAVGPTTELGAETAERFMQVNFLGTVRMVDAALPLLRAGNTRSIVNLSSLSGCISPPWMAAYSASKHAVNAYFRSLRQELHSEGFHIGLVMAGPVSSPMTAESLHGRYYRLPPGIPVATTEQTARAIMRMLKRRRKECFVPARLGMVGRLGAFVPGLVDRVYRWTGAL